MQIGNVKKSTFVRDVHQRSSLFLLCCSVVVSSVAVAQTGENAQETIRQLQRQIDALQRQVSTSENPYHPLLDNGDGTITDIVQGLMWTKRQVSFTDLPYHPSDASYAALRGVIDTQVKAFRGAGYTDWRLATVEELRLLYNSLGMMTSYRATDSSNRITLPFAWTKDDSISSEHIFVNNMPQRLGLSFRNGHLTHPHFRHTHTALLIRNVGGEAVVASYDEAEQLLKELPVYSAYITLKRRSDGREADYQRLMTIQHNLRIDRDDNRMYGSDRPHIRERYYNRQAQEREAREAYIRQHETPIREALKVFNEIKAEIMVSSLEGLWLSRRTTNVRSAKDYKLVMNRDGRVIMLCHDTFTKADTGQTGSYEERDNGSIIMRFSPSSQHTGSIENDRTSIILLVDGEDREFRREWTLHRDIRLW